MGNIGYIGGNIGYIGSGPLNMDYPYEHGTAHYQLWKPPGSYFARGEAPPPYEEAIALAQAESLSTCTVSVATSTQRQYPIGLTETEATQTITANTTNLINININNGGNLTAIATGENHIASAISTADAQIDTSNTNVSNETCVAFPTSYYTIPVTTSEVCTNQNCDLNLGSNCTYSLSNASNLKDVQTCTNQTIVSSTNATTPKNRAMERFADTFNNSTNRTILPPPIFDSIANEPTTASEEIASITKLRPAGKRYHRTIPRHYTAVDPIINPLKANRGTIVATVLTDNSSNIPCKSDAISKNNRSDPKLLGAKKMSCQCPVQHTPMSYLSSHVAGINQHASNESATISDNGRALTIKKRPCDLTRNINMPKNTMNAHINPLTPTQCKSSLKNKPEIYDGSESGLYSSTDFVKLQYVPNSSKPANDLTRFDANTGLKKQNSLTRKSGFMNDNPLVVNPVSKTCPDIKGQEVNTKDIGSQNLTCVKQNASYDRETHRKLVNSSKPNIEQNPELPPKMYKHNIGRSSGAHRKSYYSNSKTHAISKLSSDNAKFSIPITNSANLYKDDANQAQRNHFTKSLPRNVAGASHEYAQLPQKSAYGANDSSSTSINFNTLPKKNKHSTRSSNLLTEVVSKVPSVINIPSTFQPPPLLEIGNCAPESKEAAFINHTLNNNKKSVTKRANNDDSSRSDHTYSSNRLGVHAYVTKSDKPLPVLTTSTNCVNPKEHFLPNDNSLDDDYLSECENCKSAHGSRYYLEEEIDGAPQETMTLQRKMPENEEDQQNYYRVSSTLPTNTSRKTPIVKNRDTWFTTIPASSSSEEDIVE
ncbi:uncharacterized protein LOC128734021 [Sabethes cyaneus]|uniref:uncharacterized protein LOC128734021 n=1 Tax=Sabethes cyaneus TaxID=53552 RepID=UPI00237E3E25|nr:uncharacterized protein LOC128734021 [Sabethes cyaneus]